MRTRSNDNTPDGFSTERNVRSRSWLYGIALAISMASVTGCSATVRMRPTMATVDGYAVAPVDAVPVAIERYPRYYYDDRYAYLVDGRWYYPTDEGWVIFLEEPRPLTDYRTRVQTAPPGARPPDVYYGYPRRPPPPPSPPRELRREYRPE